MADVDAYVALLLVHLHFPDAGSLKAKRKELASVKAQLHGRLGAAVAEVGHQDLWQRATLAAALTGGSIARAARAPPTASSASCSTASRRACRVERTLASFEDWRD